MIKRFQWHVEGIVQGVGFRPCVSRIAKKLTLTGFVCNTGNGVIIEVQGDDSEHFFEKLLQSLPVQAKIKQSTRLEIAVRCEESDFTIKPSLKGSHSQHTIMPDSAPCDACLKELFAPQGRYYLYPFIACCDCGPRYSISHRLPFDRENTSMGVFNLCRACLKEYQNVEDRRFHAQTMACTNCGPSLSHSMDECITAIKQGKILALKAVGGFQLICDANNQETIARLRQRKERGDKPFALMALNSDSVARWVKLSQVARELLESSERPIVLLKSQTMQLPSNIAPSLNHYGFMLPSTPLHYLLFHGLHNKPKSHEWLTQNSEIVLCVTSANLSGHPLIKDESDEELLSLADKIAFHDRDIVSRIDDSVLQVINNQSAMIRRARGYALQAIELPDEIPPTLALGADLKNTLCITRGQEAFVSQHIGSLGSVKSITSYHEVMKYLLGYLNVQPQCVVNDWHPDFLSTQMAEQFNLPHYAIQHHHAHAASVAVEYQLKQPYVALLLDGFGLGQGGAAWGGELLYCHEASFEHLGSLKPLALPGGDVAAKEPWRMGVSLLHAMGLTQEIEKRYGRQGLAVATLLDKQINSPVSSSCGRYFDAVSSLLSVCHKNTYEGQAAMQLQALVDKEVQVEKSWRMESGQLDILSMIKPLLTMDKPSGAAYFHSLLSHALVDWVVNMTDNNTLILSGGCTMNQVLVEKLLTLFSQQGVSVYYPIQLPANDGGISLGQAWLGGLIHKGKE